MLREKRFDTIALIGVFCDVSTSVNHKSVYRSMKTVDFVFENIDYLKQIITTK